MKGTINSVILVGSLVGTPQNKDYKMMTITELAVATYRMKGSKNNGSQQEVTDVVSVRAFGNTGDFCRTYLQDGDKVLVKASIQMTDWVAKDGTHKKFMNIVADSVELISRQEKGNGSYHDNKKEKAVSNEPDFTDEIPF